MRKLPGKLLLFSDDLGYLLLPVHIVVETLNEQLDRNLELVRVGGTDFRTLLKGARCLCFAC